MHWYAGENTGDTQVGVLSCVDTSRQRGCRYRRGMIPPEGHQEAIIESGAGQVKKYVTISNRA